MKKKVVFIVLIFLYLELIFKIFGPGFRADEILIMSIYALAHGILYLLVISLFKEKYRKWINVVFISSVSVIFFSQFIYYKIYDTMYLLQTTKQGVAVSDYFGFVVETLSKNLLPCILFLLPLIISIVFLKKLFTFEFNKNIKIYLFLTSLILFLLPLVLMNKEQMKLYSERNNPELNMRNFGVIKTLEIDIKRNVFGFEEKEEIYFEEEEEENNPEPEEKEIEYNKLDIDFKQMEEFEENGNLKIMHKYFDSKSASNKNEYTGVFEGKNLIWILAESFDSVAIDEDLTPNLYKLQSEGLNFTNFYTPIFASTIDGEYMTKLGLLPKANVWSLAHTANNDMPFTISNMLKNEGYKTSAIHNGQATYYDRHLSHPNLGYDYYACGRGLNINCNLWPQSDSEMILKTADNYMNSDTPFMTYYLTISGHLQYNRYNAMGVKHYSKVKDLDYSESLKYFLAQNIELDLAIEELLNKLEENGKLDDTVIAISSDHWPYGLTPEILNEKSDINRADFFERERMPFIIWSNDIEHKEVDTLASSIDIAPTIMNMFNLKYDSRLFMGTDIFADSEKIVIYSNRSWITEKGKYNIVDDKFTGETTNVDSYIEEINNLVNTRFYISSLMLDNNYYQYIKVD